MVETVSESNIAANLAQVRARMALAAQQAQRNVADICLIAVSKTRSAAEIEQAFQAGQINFGENYLQEALPKLEALRLLPLVWHFIGPIQSNKTRLIAENFSWVHGVESLRIAKRLSDQRPADLPPLNICLQVNLDAESSKSGVAAEPEKVAELALQVAELPRLRLRGLMAIPAPHEHLSEQRAAFARLKQLLSQVPDGDVLSMGMSDDLEAAIQEGATHIRIGTAIFGERPPKAVK